MITSAGISIKVEDVVTYTPHSGGTRYVRITALDSDIKNGRPGFDGVEIHSGQAVWGYADQVTSLYARAARKEG